MVRQHLVHFSLNLVEIAMNDWENKNIRTDKDGVQYYKDSGLKVPKPIDGDSSFTTYDAGCALCGSYACRGQCFK
jgi:hypothetical protein